MNIRQPGTLRRTARELLERAPQLRQILLVYCGIFLASCLVVTGLVQVVSRLMARSGGLGNLGTRSLLGTVQTLLPIARTLILLALDLGLMAAMLRISRGQYTSVQTLRTGIARFFPLLLLTILRVVIYGALAIASSYAAAMLFCLTPMSNSVVELLLPMVSTGADPQQVLNTLLMDEVAMLSFLRAVAPMYAILAVVFLGLLIPVSYRLGVAELVILEDPRAGAFRAISASIKMTRCNCMAFFRLDLSFWWYFLLTAVVAVLPMLDMFLPMSEAAGWALYGLSLLIQVLTYYFLRPRLEVSRCLIYNAIRPKPQPTGQAIGNIFQL